MFKVSQSGSARRTSLVTALLVAGLMSACSSDDDDSGDPQTQIPDSTSPTDENTPGDTSMPSPTFDLVPEAREIEAAGRVYTDTDGNALYTRYTDEPGIVTCETTCAQQWPAFTTTVTAQGISGNFDVITRADGTSQWTLYDYPLHLYSGDAAPGDITGDSIDNQWALARPIPTTSADIDGEALVASSSTLSDGSSAMRVDRTGYTLYFSENDTDGVSNCNGTCSNSWQPLYADTGAVPDGNRYTLIEREDGTTQWAYDGKALYFWQGDNAAGESTGDEVATWSIARP